LATSAAAEPGRLELAGDRRESARARCDGAQRGHGPRGDRLVVDVLGRVHGQRVAERVDEARRHREALVEAAAQRVAEVRGREAVQRVRERLALYPQRVAQRRLYAQLRGEGIEDAQQVRLAAPLGQQHPHRAIACGGRLELRHLVEGLRDALRLGAQRLVEERAHHGLLVIEVLVERADAEAGYPRHAVRRGGGVALAAQHAVGGGENGVDRAARTRLARCLA
jgi:hypothetical protein